MSFLHMIKVDISSSDVNIQILLTGINTFLIVLVARKYLTTGVTIISLW